MSVQAGIWNFDGKPVDQRLLEKISESLKHQGPDGKSFYVDGPFALLYRPFHTTAESRREKQPYFSRRGFILTWDGRLDNRDELIPELRGALEENATDVAIVAAAFDRWETKCLGRIVGDWAVSVYKPEHHELTFAVDFMAARHIFYSLQENRIRWSTELSPLISLSGDKFHIDHNYVAGYFAHDPDAHLTPYREIREVPPGQLVCIRNGSATVERFWRFSPKSRIRYKTDVEYEEQFRHLFRQSVRRRLRSDLPILAELSGGVDSSSIVCMADDIISSEGKQFPRLDTISYYDDTEPNGDDSIYFPKIEQKRGRVGIHVNRSKRRNSATSLQSREFQPLPGTLGEAWATEDERSEVALRGTYRTVLSGIGGDEFMGGIPDPRAQIGDLLVQFKLIRLAKQLSAWSFVKRRPWIQLLWQSAVAILPAPLGQYLMKEAQIESWIRKDFSRRTGLAIRRLCASELDGSWLPTRRSCLAGVQLMAAKLAKCMPSMPANKEARYPYLDQNLIEFILSMPASQVLRPGERRSLMRRSLKSVVPPDILSRPTKQFGARTPILILEQHSDELDNLYKNSLSSCFGYVHDDQFLKTIGAARSGKTVSLVRILRAISLEYWLRDLTTRGLFDLPACGSSLFASHELRMTS
jgi:asparagine synthase (glutamine-hydrolysing)